MSESRVKIVGQITGSPSGSINIGTDEIINTDAPISQSEQHFGIGDTTITPPSTTPGIAKGMIIIPDLTSTAIKKLKGIAGDTGFQISTTLPTMITFETPVPIIINCATNDGKKNYNPILLDLGDKNG